jgi:ribulose-phosphate 3-epimerase
LAKSSADKRERSEFPAVARGRGVHIAPSLLAANFANLGGCLSAARQANLRWIHLDIMDGHFVPNLTFGPPVVESLRRAEPSLFFDVHLMVADPKAYIKPFVEAGAQLITFHVEAAGEDSANLLRTIRRHGLQAGISIRPKTPVSAIEPYLDLADLVLVMTVEPGFGGQKLIPSTVNKVRELCLLREERGLSYLIQVDGGINAQTVKLAVAAGSDVLVAGSAIFGGGAVRENLKEMRKALATIR